MRHQRDPLQPAAIDELWSITIGGTEQVLHVLARDAAKPVVLFFHGGPGIPHMPFAYVNAELADSFVLVQWDQRGAGKSQQAIQAGDTLSLEQLIHDAAEILRLLCAEFEQQQVVLVGHSFGSVLAMLVAHRCPHRVAAVVGIGQVTSLAAAERERFELCFCRARESDNQPVLDVLKKLGPPPYETPEESDTLEAVGVSLFSDCSNPYLDPFYRSFAVRSLLYTNEELGQIASGVAYSQGCLWPTLKEHFDLAEKVQAVDVPLNFIVGRNDIITPPRTVRSYFDRVDAPRGKRYYELANVGHWLHLEAPVAYRKALRLLLEASGVAGARPETPQQVRRRTSH